MRVYSHYAVDTLSNTYMVGLPGGKAFLVDPSVFDVELLELIEHHHYNVGCVLLTHNEEAHLAGLRALMRVYTGIQVYTTVPRVLSMAASLVAAGDRVDLCGAKATVIGLPGHGRDRVAYYVGGFLFCGPAFSAGEVGRVPNPYAKAMLLADIAGSLFTLPEETVILPFYGPPTTIGVEKRSFPMEDPLALAGLT